MRDTAGDVTPGGHALGADQIGDVIKGNNVAFKPAVLCAAGGHSDQQIFHRPLPRYLDLALCDLSGTG